jgi:hypothetical protein
MCNNKPRKYPDEYDEEIYRQTQTSTNISLLLSHETYIDVQKRMGKITVKRHRWQTRPYYQSKDEEPTLQNSRIKICEETVKAVEETGATKSCQAACGRATKDGLTS